MRTLTISLQTLAESDSAGSLPTDCAREDIIRSGPTLGPGSRHRPSQASRGPEAGRSSVARRHEGPPYHIARISSPWQRAERLDKPMAGFGKAVDTTLDLLKR